MSTAAQATAPTAGGTRRVRWRGLRCPVCRTRARRQAPGYWRVRDGLPAPQASHTDGTALCPDPLTGRPHRDPEPATAPITRTQGEPR